MGGMSTQKGKSFERRIAALIRGRFPGVECHRSSQADRAYDSDLVCTGHPVLERLWLELQDARKPTPRAKLEQAERDVRELADAHGREARLPVVVWHRLGEQSSWATMKLGVLSALLGMVAPVKHAAISSLVTLDLVEFLELLR